MARLVLAGLLSLALLGFCAYAVVTTWVFPASAVLKIDCGSWLDHPSQRWLALRGCVLEIDQVVVENDAGDFETLSNRQRGLSQKPYDVPPTWIAAWIPVTTELSGRGLVRAVYRIDSQDLVKWVNTLERADERLKEKMWADAAPLRRMSRPGVLPGRAAKPSSEGLQKAFGSSASVALLAILPGAPPPPEAPVLGILAGLAGLLLFFFTLRQVTRGNFSHLAEATAEQQLTQVDVSDVELQIGALEQLREEERVEKKLKRKTQTD